MSELILDEKIATSDPWYTHADHDDNINDYVIASYASWCSNRQVLLRQPHRGIFLEPDQGPELLLEADNILSHVALIALAFPKFTDGRGYSNAYLLRTRYGFTGQLRAVGEILPDTVFYLKRCGFNAFVLPDRQRAETALANLNTFNEPYQGSVITTLPLFKRHPR